MIFFVRWEIAKAMAVASFSSSSIRVFDSSRMGSYMSEVVVNAGRSLFRSPSKAS